MGRWLLSLFLITLGMNGLGTLPPPASLTSLPVNTGPPPTVVWSMAGAAANTLPHSYHSGLPNHAPVQTLPPCSNSLLPGSSPSSPGLILSPATDPIPQMLVQRIQTGQFVEMRDLLADNVALLNQLSSLQGTVSLPVHTASRTRLREIPSLVSWLYCFNAYVAVRTPDILTRNMLAYSRLIIREALRHGGSGWLEYDRIFRRQLSINPLMSWNTLEPSLQAATILGQRNASGTLCTLCQESDHLANQCALAPLQQQPPITPAGTPQPTAVFRPMKRPETLLKICVAWNKGRCSRPQCTFRHICATCQKSHRARDCPDTPAGSEYKMVQTTPLSNRN